MLTDEVRRKITSYLPNPKDETLKDAEYYVLDSAERVHKVRIRCIYPYDAGTEYAVLDVNTGKNVYTGQDGYHGFRMGYLYDNKTDCKNHEHDWFDGWEDLRRRQADDN